MIGDVGKGITILIAFIATVAASLGALAVWGIPKLWMWVKPLLHAWTA